MIVSSSLFLFLFYFHFSLQQNMKVSFVQADNGERERGMFPFPPLFLARCQYLLYLSNNSVLSSCIFHNIDI